jgi:hypothetical protein
VVTSLASNGFDATSAIVGTGVFSIDELRIPNVAARITTRTEASPARITYFERCKMSPFKNQINYPTAGSGG